MEWSVIAREEQETIISIDYFEKTISVYTSRKQVGERLLKKIGEPDVKFENQGRVYAVEYKRNLFDKDVAKFFSKMLMIGTFRDGNGMNDENIEF